MEALAMINPYVLLAAALWTIPWQAWSLWLAARRGDIWWFLAFVILNTLGLLNMFYIFAVAKQSDQRGAV